MEVGTWGEWAGAIGTTAAATVAVFLGARDDEGRRERLSARRRLHALAKWRLRAFTRWEAKVEEPDGREVTAVAVLDRECAAFYLVADSLGHCRRRLALRVIREIYGDRAMEHVALVDNPDLIGTAQDHWPRVVPTVNMAVDGDPGPLRRRGAMAASGEDYQRLRRLYRALLRL